MVSSQKAASYVAEMLRGLQSFTKRSPAQELVFLNFLLATAEREAKDLATRSGGGAIRLSGSGTAAERLH
jgi:aspartate/tyrosine/aromatic aminotransferase